ncbi:hypothetical protein [Erythrobacter alti]|uniref:cupin domain-containing protein n=1 Tax=Erythrobacter alti TaxID=1896145 RepID=UPI0030F48606
MSKIHVQDGAENEWTPIRSVIGRELSERMTEGELLGEFKPHDRGDPAGLELLEVYYPADAEISVHAHLEDEIIFVVDGSIQLGNRTYGKGSSLFVARHTLYGFKAGPEGLHLVNFRAKADASFITSQDFMKQREQDRADTAEQ